MKPIEIVADDDERLFISFTVKGIVFTVPRYDAIDADTYTVLIADLSKIQKDSKTAMHVKRRAATLRMLSDFVAGDDYAVLEGLKLVQLDDIARHWAEQSSVSLGELLSSLATSTASTEAPSSSISSPSSESDDAT